ncbi:MAG TPA: TetR/AcrR family transcriptional regulator [Kofleriaceae bacterium]|nr:TetR/AcrR family transcriptional regulator [Kofleriaceae bacterium]
MNLTPRKQPKQGRSRATWEAILTAAAQVLVAEGVDRATTNRIAEVAGVSIGSLYQYFPNKAAIMSAIIDRHLEDMLGMLGRATLELADRPLAEAVRHYVAAVIEVHKVHPDLHRVLSRQLGLLGGDDKLSEMSHRAHKLVRGYLELRRSEIRAVDIDLAAWILVVSVDALIHQATIDAPERLATPAFAGEICALVLRYLGVEGA